LLSHLKAPLTAHSARSVPRTSTFFDNIAAKVQSILGAKRNGAAARPCTLHCAARARRELALAPRGTKFGGCFWLHFSIYLDSR